MLTRILVEIKNYKDYQISLKFNTMVESSVYQRQECEVIHQPGHAPSGRFQYVAPHGTVQPKSNNPKCHHLETYSMSCTEADQLWTRAQARCEICGVLDRDAPFGLYIDHDWRVGHNAVRGLLCTNCNTRLDDPKQWPWPAGFAYSATYYLANAWYLRPGAPAVTKKKSHKWFATTEAEPEVVHRIATYWKPGRSVSACTRALMPRFHMRLAHLVLEHEVGNFTACSSGCAIPGAPLLP